MIFFFSGTGNSRYVANSLCADGEKIVDMAADISSAAAAQPIDTTGEKRIIWVFPVYAWGMPGIVSKFIESVNLCGAPQLPHYMVCTCGDDIGLTDRQWRGAMKRRGWKGVGAYSVTMPNTYVTLPGFDTDPKDVEERKLKASAGRIAAIAEAIERGDEADDVVPGALPWVKSRILRPFFNRFLMSPRPFKASDACIGCGKCSSACPTGNITMTSDQRPSWGNECQMCLACYHICPRHAVEYGSMTRRKGQYSGPKGVKKMDKNR